MSDGEEQVVLKGVGVVFMLKHLRMHVAVLSFCRDIVRALLNVYMHVI